VAGDVLLINICHPESFFDFSIQGHDMASAIGNVCDDLFGRRYQVYSPSAF
jgi:hypothetical protein